MATQVEKIKQLRDETQASIGDINQALKETDGDVEKAREWLQKKGFEKAAKKGERATGEGIIESYIHNNARVGVLLELSCETDFVAKTTEFKGLAHEVAMQIAAMNPATAEELLEQAYIRDASKTIGDLIKEEIARLGENIQLKRFTRYEVGGE